MIKYVDSADFMAMTGKILFRDPTPDELFAELVKQRPCEKCETYHESETAIDSHCRMTRCPFEYIHLKSKFTPRPVGKTLDEIHGEFSCKTHVQQQQILIDALDIAIFYRVADSVRWFYIARAMGYVEQNGLWVNGEKII